MKFLAALGILAFLAPSAFAQEDKDALKKKILKDVEERLKKQDDQLLRDIEKMIDEQLGSKPAAPSPLPTPKAEPKALPKPPPAQKAETPPKKARGFMGVRTDSLADDEKTDLKVKNGIKVVEVVKDGPADKAGLKVDDVITSIDGRSIDSPQEVPPIIQAAGAGTAVKLEVVREGKKQTIEVTLARHPADTEQGQAPKPDPKAPDLRERVKKFLDKKEEAPQAEAPKQDPKPKAKPAPPPKEDEEGGLAFDEKLLEQIQPLLDQFGIEPDQFFDKGKDGKYRLKGELQEMLKNFDFKKLFGNSPFGDEDPIPLPKKKAAPRKEEPKAEAPKAEAPKAARPWLGVQPEELSDELRAQLDLEDGVGLLVSEVLENSPAQKAGLKKNDILLKIDGRKVKGEEALAKFMQTAVLGQETTLTILRKGKEQSLKATISERKD
jgi:type II secretory pathway component PulC